MCGLHFHEVYSFVHYTVSSVQIFNLCMSNVCRTPPSFLPAEFISHHIEGYPSNQDDRKSENFVQVDTI